MKAVVVIVENSKKEILLLRRNYPPLGWCLPGGKIDIINEALVKGVKRELKEETGIDVNERYITFIKNDISADGGVVAVFKTKVQDETVKISKEHSNYLWVYEILPEIPLAGNTLSFLSQYTFDSSLPSESDTIEFGKYRGAFLGEIAKEDPEYILWLRDVPKFKMRQSIIRTAENILRKDRDERQHIKNMERTEELCLKRKVLNLEEAVETPFGKAVDNGQGVYRIIDDDGDYTGKLCNTHNMMWEIGTGYEDEYDGW